MTMLITSRPLFVYLQRPDNAEWATVGRYLAGPLAGAGRFRYAPSYVDAGLSWSIDPVNLPFRPEDERLAPAFDVVPNPLETPRTLTLQLSTGRFDISRPAVLADAHRFGFDSIEEAGRYLDRLLNRVYSGFDQVAHWLDHAWQETLRARMQQNISLLKATGSQGA